MQNFESIYKQHVKDIFRYSMFKLKNKDEAEDVTSETFLRAFKSENTQKATNIKAWLISISRNVIFEKYRKESKTSVVDDEAIGELASVDLHVEDKAVQQELLELIKNELDNLDDSTREVLILKIWEDLSFKEISELINEKESTVKLRLYRGLEKLKLKLSSDQKSKKYVVAIPLIISGINQIRKSTNYSPVSNYLASLSKSLNINSSQFIMKPILLKSLIGTLIAGLVITSSIFIFRPETSVQSPVSSYPSNYSDTNQNCLTTYTNELYPDFSFEYDKCKWELKENITDKTISLPAGNSVPPYKVTEIILKSGNVLGKISLNQIMSAGGRDSCINEDYRKISNSIALTKSNIANNFEYILVDNIYEKGTEDFNRIISTLSPFINAEDKSNINKDTSTICFEPSFNKSVESSIPSEPYKVVLGPTNGNLNFLLKVNIENSSFEEIENSGFNEIIKAINFEKDIYANWKTCSEAELNLSFKVPQDWNCEVYKEREVAQVNEYDRVYVTAKSVFLN